LLKLQRTPGRWWIGLLLLVAAVAACTEVPPSPSAAETAVSALPHATPTQEMPAYPVDEANGPVADPSTPYPIAEPTPRETAVVLIPYPAPDDPALYLPIIGSDGDEDPSAAEPTPVATGVATPVPSPVLSPTPTPIPTVNFAAVRADLQAQGQDLAFVKIGFHVSVGGNKEGLDEWMEQLDAAGVPFFLKSADNAEPIYKAQEMMRQSGVPHTLVYRKVSGGDHVSVPNYSLPPDVAAQQHWQLHTEAFPPELDPSLVWMETMNEVDKERHEWLAQFALTTAQFALRDGYKWAAFGWASGEPEPAHWQTPTMLALLRLMGEHPEQLAIAVHEYSYVVDDIGHGYPYKIGRFLELFRIADAYGIPRPTVLITEWGWTYVEVPEPAQAMTHIEWASRLYAPYPQVKGAAIWYLGPTHANLADLTQRLIHPLLAYSLTHYFIVPRPPDLAPLNSAQYPPP
jgi:hypothetical protein